MANSEFDLRALEALIFASEGPIGPATLRRAFPRATPSQLGEAVAEINRALAASGRPYEIAEVAAGWQFRTRPQFAEAILAAQPERKLRLSRPALETLALVAYRQPLTRAEIEDLRGVDCGAVVKSLLERDLVRIVGRRDAPGRPALYGTSASFLEIFGLRGLSDLPALREIEAIVAAPSEEILLDDGEAAGSEPEPDPETPSGDASTAPVEPAPPEIQLH